MDEQSSAGSDINPYQVSGSPEDTLQPASNEPPPWPSPIRRLLNASVLATTVTITMVLSISYSWWHGPFDSSTIGYFLSGGIWPYTHGALLHLPVISCLGALFVCFVIPIAMPSPQRLPGWLSFSLLHIYAFFAASTINVQHLTKAGMLGEVPYLTIPSVVGPISVWIVALILAFIRIRVVSR